MKRLRATLLSDGSSDRTLIPILDWLLQRKVLTLPLSGTQWADFGYRLKPPENLKDRVRCAVEDYPCDLLFVHRDAEAQDPVSRKTEIERAVEQAGIVPPAVCVIPVRMTEAWLLLDEAAIRSAAGNPRGRQQLNLPPRSAIERTVDPKAILFQALQTASEQTGRRLRNLRVDERRHRVAELMDCSSLCDLQAFQRLESELTAALTAGGWVHAI